MSKRVRTSQAEKWIKEVGASVLGRRGGCSIDFNINVRIETKNKAL